MVMRLGGLGSGLGYCALGNDHRKRPEMLGVEGWIGGLGSGFGSQLEKS